jgi:hypothetical protein
VLVTFFCNRPAVGSTDSVEVQYIKRKKRGEARCRVRVRGIFNIFIATSRQLMAAEGGFMKTWGTPSFFLAERARGS